MNSLAKVLLFSSLVAATCCWPIAGVAGAGGWGLPPEKACTLLDDRRLAARGDYRQNGDVHQCRSARRNITGSNDVPHDIRFVGQGDASMVRQLRLELRVNSRSGIQRALARLADDAESLARRSLGEPLPSAVREAILGPVAGQWVVNGRTVTLRRITAGRGLFELRLSIS